MWLRVLRGPANFINNNLALRPGMLGRLGRIMRVGPRQNSNHTSSKLFKFLNSQIVDFIGFFFGRELVSKSLHGRANLQSGYFFFGRWYMKVSGFALLLLPVLHFGIEYERKFSF